MIRPTLFAAVAGGLGLASFGLVSCGADTSWPLACDAVPAELVQQLIGPATSESFEVETLSECRWTGVDDELVLRMEEVPDAALFIQHTIDGTDPERVGRVPVGEGGVLLEGEAALARQGRYVAMATTSGRSMDDLVPVLDAAVLYLRRDL